jgi:hypothetical protein
MSLDSHARIVAIFIAYNAVAEAPVLENEISPRPNRGYIS